MNMLRLLCFLLCTCMSYYVSYYVLSYYAKLFLYYYTDIHWVVALRWVKTSHSPTIAFIGMRGNKNRIVTVFKRFIPVT